MVIKFRSKDYQYYMCGWSEELSLGKKFWGRKQFDVFILNFDKTITFRGQVKLIIEDLIKRNTDWFHTVGFKAEYLHDEIDLASVRLGRQKAVGDGSPMTAWFEEITRVKDMADHIKYSGLGHNNRVVVVFGKSKDFKRCAKIMKKMLR